MSPMVKMDDSCIKMTHGYYNQSIEIPCIEAQCRRFKTCFITIGMQIISEPR